MTQCHLVEPFKPTCEKIEDYKERFDFYCTALGIVMLLTLIYVFSVVILIIRVNHVIKKQKNKRALCERVSEESKSIHLMNKVIHHYIGNEDLKLYSFKVDGIKA